MATNNNAVEHLMNSGYMKATSENAVYFLIEGGFIEADEPVITEPERIAKVAKDWIGSANYESVFGYASGWSTAGWEEVLKEPLEHDIAKIKNVFAALVILAKEDGIEF